jgi:hypothetical protein
MAHEILQFVALVGVLAYFAVVPVALLGVVYCIGLTRSRWRRIPRDPEGAAYVVQGESVWAMVFAGPALLGSPALVAMSPWATPLLAGAVATYAIALIARRRIRLRAGSRWIPLAYAAAVTLVALWALGTQILGATPEASVWEGIAAALFLTWAATSSVVAFRFALATQRAESPEGDPAPALPVLSADY